MAGSVKEGKLNLSKVSHLSLGSIGKNDTNKDGGDYENEKEK
jgi:hypothetical protein